MIRTASWLAALVVFAAVVGCGGGGGGGATSQPASTDQGSAPTITSDGVVGRDTGAIEGRVVDDNGAPVAGVAVSVGTAQSRATSSFSTVTDADGWYRFGNLPPGTYSLTLERTGFWTTTYDTEVKASEVSAEASVNIPTTTETPAATARLYGLVKATNDTVIAGATVVAAGSAGAARATTDEHGVFLIEGLAAGLYRVLCQAEGYVEASLQDVRLEAGQARFQRFVLRPVAAASGQIRGTVRAGDQAVAEARVYAVAGDTKIAATTTAAGVYELSGLAAGLYRVYCSAAGYAAAGADVRIEAGGQAVQDFNLTATAAANGRIVGVVRAASGEALAKASVAASGTGVELRATTSDDGSYRLADLPPGQYLVAAGLSGYETVKQEVKVAAGQSTTANFELKAKTASKGRIVGTVAADGKAVAGAKVVVAGEGVEARATTTGTGRYEINDLAPGGYRVTCQASGYESATAETAITAGQATHQDFALTANTTTGKLVGTVRNAGNQAVGGATIKAVATGIEKSATSNGDGRYEFGELPAGTYRVYCQATGYANTVAENVVVTAGHTTEQNFSLTGTQQTNGRVVGTVRNSANEVLHGAQVTAVATGTNKSASSNADGRYELESLPPGTYKVYCAATGYQSKVTQNVTVAAGQATEVNFSLTPNEQAKGRLVGTVRNATNEVLHGAQIKAVTSGGEKSATTNAEGRYELNDLAPGTYKVYCQATGYRSTAKENVTVTSGQATEVNFQLSPTPQPKGRLVGTVRNASNEPLQGAQVKAVLSGIVQSATTNAAGRYELNELAPGTYRVYCLATGYQSTVKEDVTVTSGQATEVNFSLQRQ